jgi:putative membrane protein insertion efficiency factor
MSVEAPVENSHVAAGPGATAPGRTARLLIMPIRFYQCFISPVLPPMCRFSPSCSAYAIGALREHGALLGLWLALRRLSRCHPWHLGGHDPVPPRRGTA